MPAYTEADIPQMQGMTCLVTGANTGIGYELARVMAARGARVILGCRSPERGEQAAAAITRAVGGGQLRVLPLDLASLSSVRQAVAQIANEGALAILVNNAGVMGRGLPHTEDGFEAQFGTNHLGHFALTLGLLPQLAKQPGARVVTVSSLAHRQAAIDLDMLRDAPEEPQTNAYSASKLANLLFAFELQKRLAQAGSKLLSVACHPGASATEIVRHMPSFVSALLPLMSVVLNSAAQGALPLLRAATDPQVSGGEYFGPAGFFELRSSATLVRPARGAQDETLAEGLWNVSQSLTGVSWDPAALERP